MLLTRLWTPRKLWALLIQYTLIVSLLVHNLLDYGTRESRNYKNRIRPPKRHSVAATGLDSDAIAASGTVAGAAGSECVVVASDASALLFLESAGVGDLDFDRDLDRDLERERERDLDRDPERLDRRECFRRRDLRSSSSSSEEDDDDDELELLVPCC